MSAKTQPKARNSGLQRAIDACGGPSGLAARLGNISSQAVSLWTHCPPRRLIDVERVSGVPRDVIRPDLFAPPTMKDMASVKSKDLSPESDGQHFSRFFHLRRAHFRTAGEVEAHVEALRNEWERR